MRTKKEHPELEKLKHLSPKKRVQYIFDYYKFPILAVIVVIVLTVSIIQTVVSHKEVAFNAVLLNAGGTAVTSNDARFASDFAEAAGINTNAYSVYVDCSNVLNLQAETQYDLAVRAKISALFAAKEIDILGADPEAFDDYARNGAFMDLRHAMDKDMLNKLETRKLIYYVDAKALLELDEEASKAENETTEVKGERDQAVGNASSDPYGLEAVYGTSSLPTRIISTDNADMAEPVPIGVAAATSRILLDGGYYQGKEPVVGIVDNTTHVDSAEKFIEFLDIQ
jgi:hypothetical protein